jgi:hypothetical protein
VKAAMGDHTRPLQTTQGAGHPILREGRLRPPLYSTRARGGPPALSNLTAVGAGAAGNCPQCAPGNPGGVSQLGPGNGVYGMVLVDTNGDGPNHYTYGQTGSVEVASAADVQQIENVFDNAVNQMNQNGQRRPGKGWVNGVLNDLEYWGTTYQACTGQSYIVCESLDAAASAGTFDANWTFTVQNDFWHTWVYAASSDPADPSLTIDPLYDTFTTNWPTTP